MGTSRGRYKEGGVLNTLYGGGGGGVLGLEKGTDSGVTAAEQCLLQLEMAKKGG